MRVGNGPCAGDLPALFGLAERLGIQDRLRRIQAMSDPRPFYHALEGFVLTSRYEGLPISALEALACDLPLILSQAPGNGLFAELGLSRLGGGCRWLCGPVQPVGGRQKRL